MPAMARIALKIATAILLALAFAYLVLFFVLQSTGFRAWAETALSQRSGLAVELGGIRLNFPFRLIAEQVRMSDPNGFRLTADRLSATLNPFDLPMQTIHRLILEKPRLRLNLQQLTGSAAGGTASIAVRHLDVKDGALVLASGKDEIFTLPGIFLAGENLDIGSQAGVHLRADVPALNAVAEVIAKGKARELESVIVIRAKRPGGEAADASVPALLRLDTKLRAPEAQATEVILDGKFHNLVVAATPFTGSLAGRIEANPALQEAAFTGHANLDLPATFAGGKLPRGNALASFAGVFSLPQGKLTLNTVRVATPLGSITGDGEVLFEPQPSVSRARLSWQAVPLEDFKTFLPAPLNSWSYQGHGQIEGELRGPWHALEFRGTARGETVQVRGAGWKTESLDLALSITWSAPTLQVDRAQLDFGNIQYNGASRWQAVAERARATASFALEANAPLRIQGLLQTSGGKFNSPGNDRIGEDLSLQASFELMLPRQTAEPWGVNLGITVDGGEILWGTFFTDLGARKPGLKMNAAYFPGNDRLECRECVVNVPEIGSIAASGAIDRLLQAPDLRLQARSDKLLPGGFFDHFLRENLHRRFPLLDRLVLGGELAFAAKLHGSLSDLSVSGELSVQRGELRSRSDRWQIGPLALHLPFEVHWPETGKSAAVPRTGVLAMERVRLGEQSFGPVRAAVSLAHNALRFHQDLRAGVFGGEIVVRDLFWPDIVANPKRLSFSLEAKGLDLEQLTATLDWPRLGGTLTGSIPEVQATANALKTNGAIQAELFGGRMTMNRVEIENPFSPLAAIRLDAELANIRLEQLSKTFAFGHISGILAGTIDDLVIVDGQPAEFRADFRSVDRGGEQRISVEALNKITVLSSGQSAGALYGGLAGFFDSFRYSKLGFKAFLQNDRLTLRGVETRGDQEYLVVGSFLPPTVNIVSHTQVIAFSELLSRLERIRSEKPQVQ